MTRFCIVLVSVVCSLLISKDAQPVAASPENSDLEIVAGQTSECLEEAPQLSIDWSFFRDDANSKQLQVMIALDTCMLIELLTTDLRDVDVRQNRVAVSDFYRALNGNSPKRLHDLAMLLLKKLCETDYLDADPDGAFQLMQCSETFIPIIESNLQRDYVALFQAYMFTAVIHNLGDAWFAMCCRKAFNLAEAHEDLERKDLVTQFVFRTHFSSNNPGKIEWILRQNAIQSKDDRFWGHIRLAFAPPPPPPAKDNDANHTTSSKGAVAASPPTYEEAKKAMVCTSWVF